MVSFSFGQKPFEDFTWFLQGKLCIGQRKYTQTFTSQGSTDRSTKRVNSRSLTKLLFRILQNSRKNKEVNIIDPSILLIINRAGMGRARFLLHLGLFIYLFFNRAAMGRAWFSIYPWFIFFVFFLVLFLFFFLRQWPDADLNSAKSCSGITQPVMFIRQNLLKH